MKVKLLIPRGGPAGSFGVGDVIEVSDNEAKRLMDANKAVPFREDVGVETTSGKRGKRRSRRAVESQENR